MGHIDVGGASGTSGLYVEGAGAGAAGNVAEATPLLSAANELLLSGDPGAGIAALGIQTAREQKHEAQVQRRDAESLEASQQNAQIEALRDKATLERVQGVVEGAMTIGAGALELGQGLNDVAMKRHEAGGDKLSAARVEGEGAWCKGGKELTDGLKNVGNGLFKGAITDKETDATLHDQRATRAKHSVDDAMGNYEDAKKLLDKALDFYKEYTGAKNGAVSAAIHRA